MKNGFNDGVPIQSGYSRLENYLNDRLTPIEPSAGFFSRFQTRLARSGSFDVDLQGGEGRRPTLRYVMFGAAGVLSSVLLVITGVRAFMSLNSAIKSIRKMKTPAAALPAS